MLELCLYTIHTNARPCQMCATFPSTCTLSNHPWAKAPIIIYYTNAYTTLYTILICFKHYIILLSATWGCLPSVHALEALKSLLGILSICTSTGLNVTCTMIDSLGFKNYCTAVCKVVVALVIPPRLTSEPWPHFGMLSKYRREDATVVTLTKKVSAASSQDVFL